MNLGSRRSPPASVSRAVPSYGARPIKSVRRWRRPTFGEFVERVRHEFGPAADLTGLQMTGFGSSDRLNPSDIEELCGQLGVPAEDFGVGP
jgi:hypothetical protein